MYQAPPPIPSLRERWWRGLWRPPAPRPETWRTLVLTFLLIGVLGTQFRVVSGDSVGSWGALLVLIGLACLVTAEVFPPRWLWPAAILRFINTLTWAGGTVLILIDWLIRAMR